VRPSYDFLSAFSARTLYAFARQTFRPDLFARMNAIADSLPLRGTQRNDALNVVTKIVLHTGCDPDQLGAEDLFTFCAWFQQHYGASQTSVIGVPLAWELLRDFEAKATVILDLYQGFYQGEPIDPGDRILSVDAKPCIQARSRIHQTQPAAPGRAARVEHEYVRHGALALLAGLDVHTGRVFASTPPTTGIAPFMDLVGHMMTQPEYRDAPRVFVIVDNGSDHRGQTAIDRLHTAHPNTIMIHTPIHASWLNQIEIFFSIIQKKVVTPNDFPNLNKLSETLHAFIDRYNKTAKPYNWKYTANDLKNQLRRLNEHTTTNPPNLAPAA
jgi:hypothetical protein